MTPNIMKLSWVMRRLTCSGRTMASLLVAILLLAPQPVFSQPQQQDTAIVRLLVPANYNDTPEVLERVRLIASALPPRVIEQAEPRSLAAIIQDLYDVSNGPRARSRGQQLPRTYAVIAEEIRERNLLAPNAEFVPAGDFLVPSLPRKALTTWNRQLARNYVPQVLSATVVPAGGEVADGLLLEDLTLESGEDRGASQLRLLELKVPTEVLAEVAEMLQPLFASGDAEVVAETLELNFLDVPTFDASQALGISPPGVQDLKAHFGGRSPVRQARLFILDSGWPDATTYQASHRSLREFMDSVRVRWGITGAPLVQPAGPSAFTPPSFAHATAIQAALQPYQSAIPSAVNIIYVPMSRDQHAGPILEELLMLDDLLARKLLRLRRSNPNADALLASCGWAESNVSSYSACARKLPLSKDDSTKAREYARSIVMNLPERFSNPAPVAEYRSSSAILSAVWNLAAVLNADERSASIINASWTVPPLYGEFNPGSRISKTVLLVAAAGNVPGMNVTGDSTLRDYAARSTSSTNVLAVMNLDANGSYEWFNQVCRSSIIDPARLRGANAVAFDGRVTNQLCGTSFATPRIAWILALDEAFRSTPLSLNNWSADIRQRLQCSRTGASLAGVAFRPLVFLSQASAC